MICHDRMSHCMETIVDQDTPLAIFLEGEGTFDSNLDQSDDLPRADSPQTTHSFAPFASQTVQSRLKTRVPDQLRIKVPTTSRISEARVACSRAINSQLGRKENTKFIEHFRYVLIASQLLNEYQDHGLLQVSSLVTDNAGAGSPGPALDMESIGSVGAVVVAGAAFLLVWILHWTRNNWSSAGPKRTRVSAVVVCFGIAAFVLYRYMRRQWLQYLRHQAVDTASSVTINVQAFELSATAALSLIQEVELVSRGYRISTPLPPISRLDDPKYGGRKCARLRKHLHRVYNAMIPALRAGLNSLRAYHNEDDYERYLDVYDISRELLQEAVSDTTSASSEDLESLGLLRMLSYRCSTLRRALLCSLLSLEADGGSPDFARWRVASEVMASLSHIAAADAKGLNDALKDMQEFTSPTTPKALNRHGSERLRSQVRKIGTLSTGIRSLQAKMALLREESNNAIEQSEDLTDLGPNLLAQYESIGADLKSLMQAWETGKAALATNLDKHERRLSLASSGFRSPMSLGGLTAVDEGGPEDALRALTGEATSNRSSLVTTPSDEEVFEAIALPKRRTSLTRGERIAKVQEDRVRQAELREKRMSSTSMIRELQSVINLRPKKNPAGRITSV